MGLSGVYGTPAGDKERLAFLNEAYERGTRFWDTGKTEASNPIYPILGIHI
jgi:aryl-alcohol dehydrogenase-like predicted oxidoreductase